MFNKNNPHALRVEEKGNVQHYYVHFRDGQAVYYEMEINFELYNTCLGIDVRQEDVIVEL